MGKSFKVPPFAVDRSLHVGLAKQVADALRNAILTGYYAPGDVLPQIRELAAITGVAQVLVVRAIRMLREERLVSPRPHVGCVVCAPDRPLWKGQVLIVVPSGGANHYLGVVSAALRDALTAAGYLALEATVPYGRSGALDFSFLDTMLDRRVNLAVQLHDLPEVSRHLAGRSVPYVRFMRNMGRDPRGCVGSIHVRMDACVPEFVAHCSERGVKRVLQIAASRYAMDAVPGLRAAGIEADEWLVPGIPNPTPSGQIVARLTATAVAARIEAEGLGWLPDVILFTDDFVAMGAMAVLSEAGVRVPRDVGVVTWANRDCGCGPVFAREPTRMEGVAGDDGLRLACAVLDYLKSGRFTSAEVVPTYIRGETFR